MLDSGNIASLADYLRGELGANDLSIVRHQRLSGGASRLTYSLDVIVDDRPRGLVLRTDPVASLLESDRALEVAAYRSFAGSQVPVPQVLCYEDSTAIIGAPFFVMTRIDNSKAVSPARAHPFGRNRSQIGGQFFTLLGYIHAANPAATPLRAIVEQPPLERCWQRELDHWEGIIDANELEPQPIARGAIRRLRRETPPPPARLAIVHGDYRNGNYMYDAPGNITAILDWEMAHIGDPMEDLAWALDPVWNMTDDSLAAGLLPRADAIALWERASEHRFDERSFAWWSLFASLKGLAIWLSSARTYSDGTNTEPILGYVGLFYTRRYNAIIADRLAP